MGQVKQELTPPCDGCACRDDELEKVRAELNRLRALMVDVLRCRVHEPFKGWDITKLNQWVEDVTTAPSIERHCSTCRCGDDHDHRCEGCSSHTKYHNWKAKERKL